MNRDLFISILALDSYNRSYGQRLAITVTVHSIGTCRNPCAAPKPLAARWATALFFLIVSRLSWAATPSQASQAHERRIVKCTVTVISAQFRFATSLGGIDFRPNRRAAAACNDNDAWTERPFHFAGDVREAA